MKAIFLLPLLLAACAKVDSSQVKSGGIYANYSVTAQGNGSASCEATFQVGSPTGTYLSLSGSDAATCDGHPMQRSEILGIVTYSAQVPYDLSRTYSAVLHRDGEPDYQSDMNLPEPLALTYPAGGETVSGSNGIELRWALAQSTAYDISVTVNGPKKTTVLASQYPDAGSMFIPSDAFELPIGSTAENFTVVVTRSKAGSFPQGLAGGRSKGKQIATRTFVVTK